MGLLLLNAFLLSIRQSSLEGDTLFVPFYYDVIYNTLVIRRPQCHCREALALSLRIPILSSMR